MEKVTFLVNNVREFDWLMEKLTELHVSWTSLEPLQRFKDLKSVQLKAAMIRGSIVVILDTKAKVIMWSTPQKEYEMPEEEFFAIKELMKSNNCEGAEGILQVVSSSKVRGVRQPNPIKPKHYDGEIEPVDVAEDWGLNFNEGSVMKYIRRAGHKYDTADEKLKKHLEDLQKADHFLQREIKLIANKAGVIL